MKVHLHTIGCRLNQAEIESLGRRFIAGGHEVVGDAAAADMIILNTCAVTAEATRDARNLTRRFHRANDTAGIVLTGCYATIAPDELANLPGVVRVVANADKERIPEWIDPPCSGGSVNRLSGERRPTGPSLRVDGSPGSFGRTRGFIKVQDGCDNRCTFCVTTIARGEGRSRHLGDVVAEVQALASAGYLEVVLTGVHLGSYGRDLGREGGLPDLVAALLAHTDVPRIRLSSLEPWDIGDGFFRLWENPRLLPHLHLPLQSGSDHVLRRMARRTSRDSFRALAAEARECIPDLSLSTDLIAGFPGETEADFAQTMDYVEELAFARLHVFSYSARPGTAAARMPGQLSRAVRRERTARLIALGERLSAGFHQRYDGAVRPVLWEGVNGAEPDGLRWAGYSDNYIRVSTVGPADLLGRVTPVRLSHPRPDGMSGEVLAR